MPITGPIPLPENGMDAFLEALQKGAETKKTMAQANLPFGGTIPPGAAGQVVGLQMLKNLYGEDSPQYKQALDAFNLNQEGVRSRVDYQNVLSGTAPKRFSTNLGKTAQELEDIKAGYLPGTRIPLDEQQKKYYEGKYGLAMLKPTTDADTRKRNLFSHNIDITLNKINPQALTQYSGLKGGAELINEMRKDQQGKASPEYKAYQQSLTNAKLLSKQVRQFYGDSITPEIQKKLQELTNPSTWLKSPEIALQNYNSFVDTLKSESETYKQATESPDVYSGANMSQQNDQMMPEQASQQMNQPKTNEQGMVVLYKNGKEYHIPPNLMREALSSGGFSIEP